MKKLYNVLIAVLTISSFLFAQSEVKPTLYAGSKALLFQFSGLANIGAGNFEGGVGGKYFLNSNLAIRGGLQFANASVSTPNTNLPDNKNSATTFGINGAVEYHLSTKRVSPYLGGGIAFSTTSTEETQQTVGGENKVSNNRNGVNIGGNAFNAGTTISVFGMVGAEFFIYDELSLGAEYRVGFSSTSQADEEVTVGNQTTTTAGGSLTTIGLTSQGFITLAIYF